MDSKNKGQVKTSKTRKILLILGVVLFILWMIWGNTSLQVSHLTISDQNLPEAFDGFKMAHLSDVHNKKWGQALIQPIEEEQPDIIVITGDLIDAETPDIDIASELINQIKAIAPIYYVAGNHEGRSELYPLLKEALLDHGVTILDNDAVTLQKNDSEILLLGLQDPAFATESFFYFDPVDLVERDLESLNQHTDGYKILLSHRPEFMETYVSHQMNLVLSGHAHGGQFRIPFMGGLVAPDQGFFPKYSAGLYEEDETKMVVSRGLGNSFVPIRFNNRFELIFIELENE